MRCLNVKVVSGMKNIYVDVGSPEADPKAKVYLRQVLDGFIFQLTI